MVKSEDIWPTYNVGKPEHLHALGVISLLFNSFERGMDELFHFHPHRQGVPAEFADYFFYNLADEKRLNAVKFVFDRYEADDAVKNVIRNLIDYFNWCHQARNMLLHAEHYPPLFGEQEDVFYISKPANRRERKRGYKAIPLSELRGIGDRIEEGVMQCTRVRLFLRTRGVPLSDLSLALRMQAPFELPGTLSIPTKLELSSTPPGPLRPAYLRPHD